MFGNVSRRDGFLGNDGEIGIGGCERVENERLGLLIGFGHRRTVILPGNIKIAGIDLHNDGAGIERDAGQNIACQSHETCLSCTGA